MAAIQSVSILWSERASARFDDATKYFLRLVVFSLSNQQIGDLVLQRDPLFEIAVAASESFRGAKVLHGPRVLNRRLRREAGQFQGLENIFRISRLDFLGVARGLQSKTFSC